MMIRQLTVSRTIQLKQYEPCSVTIAAEIEEGESTHTMTLLLLEELRAALYAASGQMRGDLAPRPPRPAPQEIPY